MEYPDDLVVNKTELCRIFDVSNTLVDRWLRDGCPVEQQGTHGVGYQFNVASDDGMASGKSMRRKRRSEEERQARIAQLQLSFSGGDDAMGSVGGGTSPVNRLTAIQAALAEDKLRRERGELISRVSVRADYEAVFGLLRQRLLALGVILTREADLSPSQSGIVQREIRALLMALPEQISDPDLRPGSDGDAPHV